ncbi:MAG: hypothetical protein V2A78_10150 [bacterium]
MHLVWGIILVLFTLILCWLGQGMAVFSPKLAVRLGLSEAETDLDPAFFADSRGEAIWDVLSIWTLPAAGILLLCNNPLWAYFGLVGGGVYLYFAGRGICVRLAMQRRGIRIGKPGTVKLSYAFLILWGLIAVVTIVLAIAALPI